VNSTLLVLSTYHNDKGVGYFFEKISPNYAKNGQTYLSFLPQYKRKEERFMRKTLKTEQDRQTAFQKIKAAANHHAHTVNVVVDHLYEAMMQYKDSDSVIIYSSDGVEFQVNESIYRLCYVNNRIELCNISQNDAVITYFDNNTEKAQVMEYFQKL